MCILKGYININFLFVFVLKFLVVCISIMFIVPRSSVLRKAFEYVNTWTSWNKKYQIHSGWCLVLLLDYNSLFVLCQREREVVPYCSKLILSVSWKTIFVWWNIIIFFYKSSWLRCHKHKEKETMNTRFEWLDFLMLSITIWNLSLKKTILEWWNIVILIFTIPGHCDVTSTKKKKRWTQDLNDYTSSCSVSQSEIFP